jgi:Skp family chaperone for outer membrane proteins
MKKTTLTTMFVFAACLSGSGVFAQTPSTQPRPQPPASQPAAPNVPVSKVAVIYSAAFQDPKNGIARFTVILNKLNGEFQKIQDELTQTAQRLKGLQDEVNKMQQTPGVTPAQIQTKIDALDQQKKEYQRKGEDAQAQYQRRRTELFTPLQDDVGKAIDAFAKARNITMVIDASQVEGILYADAVIDVTRAFISKNPATAAVTLPK